jgi:N-acetylmuramoyl-L-alanine amidase
VQENLARAGYYQGTVDGIIGPMTRSAIGNYQNDHNMPVTRHIDERLLQSLGLI